MRQSTSRSASGRCCGKRKGGDTASSFGRKLIVEAHAIIQASEEPTGMHALALEEVARRVA